MLLDAARLLPRPYRLLIWDAWRPTALQEELFAEHRERLRRQHPEYHEDHLIRETESYVSFPSGDPKSPAPHSTGGAVDLTTCDETGQPVPMGTGFDHFGPEAATRYFEERLERGERLNEEEREALFNRRLLYGCDDSAGLHELSRRVVALRFRGPVLGTYYGRNVDLWRS